MSTAWRFTTVLVIVIALSEVAAAGLAGAAFTYQGRIKQAGVLVTVPTDFEFTLWDAATNGLQVGPTLTFDGQLANPAPLTPDNGLFSASLDFGVGVFDGNDRWLQLRVATSPGGGAWVAVSPRQLMSPAPYSLFAVEGSGGNSLDAADGNPAQALFVDDSGNVGIGTTAPISTLDVNGSLSTRTRTVTSTTTLDVEDHIVFVSSGSPVTVTLPTAAGFAGRRLFIKNTGSNKVSVATTASQTIEGVQPYLLASKREFIDVVSDGANWQVIAGGTYPRLFVRKNANGGLGTGTPVSFQTTLEDTHTSWSGSAYTAPVDGTYAMNMMLHHGSAGNTNCIAGFINDVMVQRRLFQTPLTVVGAHLQGSDLFSLRAGDVLSFKEVCNGAFATGGSNDAATGINWLKIERVR